MAGARAVPQGPNEPAENPGKTTITQSLREKEERESVSVCICVWEGERGHRKEKSEITDELGDSGDAFRVLQGDIYIMSERTEGEGEREETRKKKKQKRKRERK